jgi:putative sterol carrier protein
MSLFASEEWAQALAAGINADKEMAKAAKGFDATIQFVIQGAGKRGDLPFWTHMKDGKVLEVQTGKKECEYTVAGDYAVWKEIVEGNQDPLQAIMVKKLTFEGNMQTIMRYIKAVNQMMEAVKRVPTEF